MQKIFLALGNRTLEEYLQKALERNYVFAGTTVYREGILKGVEQTKPDILILRETLSGNTNITDIIYQLRTSHPDVRIVFLAGRRVAGDALLATIVSYGIYDILNGEKIDAKHIVKLVITPNKISDVSMLIPKATIDEKSNKKLFEAPKVEAPKTEDKPLSVLKQTKEIINGIKNDVETKTSESPQQVPENKPVIPKLGKDKPTEGAGAKNRHKYNEEVTPGSTKQQIITFLGSRTGVGNTQVAFNTAIKLAQRGFKTIYIDLDDVECTASYIYQIGSYSNGLDTALAGMERDDFGSIDESIITTKGILKNTPKENDMIHNYRKFPKDLDYLFFSQEYLQGRKNKVEDNHRYFKDLIMYLSFQKEYDFIVIDSQSNVKTKLTEISLAYSTKVFAVITQDINSIYSSISQLLEVDKMRINLRDKLYYIVNKYENTILTPQNIEEWVGDNVKHKVVANILIPDSNKEFIEANYIGIPVILTTKSRDVIKGFSQIEKLII